MVFPYNGSQFNLKKEGNTDTCCNPDEPRARDTKRNKPVPNRHIVHGAAYRRRLEQSRSETDNRRVVVRNLGERGVGCCLMATEFQFYKMKKIWRRWWRGPPSNVSELNTTERDTQQRLGHYTVCCIVCTPIKKGMIDIHDGRID